MKGYKLLDIESNRIFISRDVQFHEKFFPFVSKLSHSKDHISLFDNHVLPLPVFDTISNSQLDIPLSSTSDPNVTPTSVSIDISNSHISTKTCKTTKRPSYLQDYHCALA